MNKIGVNIANRRRQLHMTQEQLSGSTGLSVNYISKVERDFATHISADTLIKLAKGLNTSMEQLVDPHSERKEIGPYQSNLLKLLNNLDTDKAEVLSKSVLDLMNLNK